MADLKLKPNTVAKIQKALESGRFQDADEVVLTALDSLEAHDRQSSWLSDQAQIGLDALDHGESFVVDDLDAYFALVKERAAKRRSAGIPINDAVKP